jgi:aldehyde dehydrogenase (NAD+)
VLVHQNIRDKFLTQLLKEIQLLFGDGGSINEGSPSYSRLATPRQFDRISSMIKDARERGAKIQQLGGINQQENFIGPTILTDIPLGATVWEEEIFGPILPVETFVTREQAADIINNRPKPLALYVFSTRKIFQDYFLVNTTAGSVCINECVLQFTHPNLPFGGVNQSGLGKSHGQYGFIAFSNEKSVLRQKSGWAAPYLLYPPYTTGMKKIVDVLLKWF